jgi:polar amino acid transport system substrate-binding protein
MRIHQALVLSAAMICAAPAVAAETWTITSLKWPPFSGSDLKKQGAGIHALRTALATVGVDLNVQFLPWKRAKAVARRDADIVGYYPSWPSEVVDGFFASATVFRSPLGFAEPDRKPLEWSDLDDLDGRKIAFVKTYIYPDALERKTAEGTIESIDANTDVTALRMLARGRVDTVAIDKFVMRYYLNTDRRLAEARDRITFDETPLVNYDLVLAFRDTTANKARAKTLKKALANVNPQTEIAAYLEGLK